jgi:predicted phage-related endonuclease
MSDVIEQRTDAWRESRAGKITASCFIDAIAISEPEPGSVYKSGPRKGQPKLPESTATRDTYMRIIAFERTSGVPRHEIGSKSLQWGSDVETFAREAYELETGNIVVESGFLLHPKFHFIGCSPDGLVGLLGGIEMKCPHDEQVHIKTILSGMPEEHMPQVQGAMLVTGREWWDFISYDPRQKESLRLYVQRIERDEAYIQKLLAGLIQFNLEVEAMIATLEKRAA